ncbi:c-type cytochrome [Rickettsia endosymbiont of Cardiosporidium cionae]|uniref:c-type cytochrome n=1 Tax=Rickettsia endosymbiont of Cardiosporidium cionae TaxID=2777155 RepID=UPI0018930CD4|nr:cytochrome c family protein [Rickettsia endosymbiont of Cardiosporidium cionae]KAF8818577.1 cytochrome c [Rickettsia endosymbiont of Cardiosporidium cionae]
MSGLEINKIIASILLSSLIAALVGFIVNLIYKPNLSISDRGYRIVVNDVDNISTESSKVEDTREDFNIQELIAHASVEHGKSLSRKCIACHSLQKDGANKIGPNLWNVVGRNKATAKGFSYSKSMIELGGVWDEESLFYFLQKPSKYLPGTKMVFIGFKKKQDIANILAFLKSQHD